MYILVGTLSINWYLSLYTGPNSYSKVAMGGGGGGHEALIKNYIYF